MSRQNISDFSFGKYDYFEEDLIGDLCSHKKIIGLIIVIIVFVNILIVNCIDPLFISWTIIVVGTLTVIGIGYRMYGYQKYIKEHPDAWQNIELRKREFERIAPAEKNN